MRDIQLVPTADACDFSKEVDDYCDEQDISTHYNSGIYQMELDGNPLQKFFEERGVVFPTDKDWTEIGVLGT